MTGARERAGQKSSPFSVQCISGHPLLFRRGAIHVVTAQCMQPPHVAAGLWPQGRDDGCMETLGGRRDLTDIDSPRPRCRGFPGSGFEVVVIVAVRITIGNICRRVAAGGKLCSSSACVRPNLTRATAPLQASRPS